MSKFKIGDIVNVLYDFDKIVKGKVIDFNQTTLGCDIEILESNDVFIIGQLYKTQKVYLKPIESTEVKQALQTKPNNDFIYFKDIDIVVPKEILQKDILNIQPISLRKDNNVINGFGVFLYSNKMLIKGFETIEQAQEFLKQLADSLGSDIL